MTVFQYKLQKMADMTRSCSQTCKLYLKWVEHDSGRFHFRIVQHSNQTLANRGPDSRFIVEAIFKPLVPKLSGSSIMITLNRAHTKHKFTQIPTCLHRGKVFNFFLKFQNLKGLELLNKEIVIVVDLHLS